MNEKREEMRGVYVHTPIDNDAWKTVTLLITHGYKWHKNIKFTRPCDKHLKWTCIVISHCDNISLGHYDFYSSNSERDREVSYKELKKESWTNWADYLMP